MPLPTDWPRSQLVSLDPPPDYRRRMIVAGRRLGKSAMVAAWVQEFGGTLVSPPRESGSHPGIVAWEGES